MYSGVYRFLVIKFSKVCIHESTYFFVVKGMSRVRDEEENDGV